MKIRRERTTAANRGFTLLEIMTAIGVLVFGLVAVLAVFAEKVPAIAKSQETKRIALSVRSIANALQVAFATPIKPEAIPYSGSWDPEGGPTIRLDFRGAFLKGTANPDEPEGFVVITLPGPPGPDTLPEDLDPLRWPRDENKTYSLARPPRPDALPGSVPTTDPVEEEPIDLMKFYSYSITIKNWRRKIRTKVPSLSDTGTTVHPDTKSARVRPYNILQENDGMQIGNNLGYRVTLRIYRNHSPRTVAERAEKRDSPSMVFKQTFIFTITTGFGVTR